MKERPILFSAPMVRAILDGSKTQTRRVVKPQPQMVTNHTISTWDGPPAALQYQLERMGRGCPYGKPGDRLWVREAFLGWYKTADKSFSHVAAYRADGYELEASERWTPSIHMPRAASRITLEVTGVRVERLQDISEADAIAEGIDRAPSMGKPGAFQWCDYRLPRDPSEWFNDPVRSYQSLWDLINGPGSWDANPWVWVVELKRTEGGAA